MNWIVRFSAYFFSVIFHPLLILTYMLIILLTVNPYLFGASTIGNKAFWLLFTFSLTFVIPAVAVVVMRALDLVDSIELKTKKERTGPYIIAGVFYLWLFRNILDNPDVPIAFKVFVLGATIGLFVAFFINLFSKISMHTVGMGGLMGMIVITMLKYSYPSFTIYWGDTVLQMSMNTLLIFTILACGIVGTSRLLLKAHEPVDLYGGYVVGFGTQFLAVIILS